MDTHRGISRGETLKSKELPGDKTYLYATDPAYFPENLAVFAASTPPTVFIWLIPISEKEKHYIDVTGWEKFEELLEELNPNLLNWNRESVV